MVLPVVDSHSHSPGQKVDSGGRARNERKKKAKQNEAVGTVRGVRGTKLEEPMSTRLFPTHVQIKGRSNNNHNHNPYTHLQTDTHTNTHTYALTLVRAF
jgi:hypothetical protein